MTGNLNQTQQDPRACSRFAVSSFSPPLSPASARRARVAPNVTAQFPSAHAQNVPEQAQRSPAPVGFADIVEKVKPAVISVRVQVDASGAD